MRSSNVNILIVEDEAISSDNMVQNLKNLGYNKITLAENSQEATAMFNKQEFDLVLMDINLKDSDQDGISIARQINKKNDNCRIIFTTNFSDRNTILRTQKVIHENYLVKPISERQLFVSIEKALGETSSIRTADDRPHDRIYIKSNNKFYERVLFDSIVCIEADKGIGSRIITTESDYFSYKSLKAIIDSISDKNIMRVHRKFAVNLKNLALYSDTELETITGKRIPIGPSYKNALKSKILKIEPK